MITEMSPQEKMFEKSQKLVVTLFNRWLDEGKYEDIEDYRNSALMLIAEETKCVIVKMNKRPFGFNYRAPNRNTYQVFCTTRKIGWKRIG